MLKFEFSEHAVQVIADALGEMPYRIAAPIMSDMQRQIQAQRPNNVRPIKDVQQDKNAEG